MDNERGTAFEHVAPGTWERVSTPIVAGDPGRPRESTIGWSVGMSEQTDTTTDAPTGDTPPFRYSAALAEEIEARWQDWWDEHGTFETPNPTGPLGDADLAADRGEKLFVLDMFPYPSGSGLHVGHPLGFIGTDVYARFKRMTGHNVLHTMGFDAFGLPAEQYAVETGQHPRITTEQNVATYRRQLRRLGLAHDRRRGVSTTDPQYYRWTQWIFRQIFNSWYDRDAGPGPPDRRADRRVRVGRTGDARRPGMGRRRRDRATADHRRPSAGLRQRRTGQLVPRAGHRRWPTKRSPPRVAPSAATSRCSSATCASG